MEGEINGGMASKGKEVPVQRTKEWHIGEWEKNGRRRDKAAAAMAGGEQNTDHLIRRMEEKKVNGGRGTMALC